MQRIAKQISMIFFTAPFSLPTLLTLFSFLVFPLNTLASNLDDIIQRLINQGGYEHLKVGQEIGYYENYFNDYIEDQADDDKGNFKKGLAFHWIGHLFDEMFMDTLIDSDRKDSLLLEYGQKALKAHRDSLDSFEKSSEKTSDEINYIDSRVHAQNHVKTTLKYLQKHLIKLIPQLPRRFKVLLGDDCVSQKDM